MKHIVAITFLLASVVHADDPITVFKNSSDVIAALEALEKEGMTEVETPVSVEIRGQCGFAGCDSEFLVVQVARSKGANPATKSVKALVTVPAVGGSSLKILNGIGNTLTFDWTMDAHSVPSILKSALTAEQKADKKSKQPHGKITGDAFQVTLEDEKSRVACKEEQRGDLTVQQYSCEMTVK